MVWSEDCLQDQDRFIEIDGGCVVLSGNEIKAREGEIESRHARMIFAYFFDDL